MHTYGAVGHVLALNTGTRHPQNAHNGHITRKTLLCIGVPLTYTPYRHYQRTRPPFLTRSKRRIMECSCAAAKNVTAVYISARCVYRELGNNEAAGNGARRVNWPGGLHAAMRLLR